MQNAAAMEDREEEINSEKRFLIMVVPYLNSLPYASGQPAIHLQLNLDHSLTAKHGAMASTNKVQTSV